MNMLDWAVLLGGSAAIVWVNWYFFAAGRSSVSATRLVSGSPAADAPLVPSAGGPENDPGPDGGVQEVTVVVRGGYEPSTIRVQSGVPVRLKFDRQETSGCSEEVVFPDFGIRRFLPAFKTTTLEVTPDHPGTYEFTCGMSMLRGRLIAE